MWPHALIKWEVNLKFWTFSTVITRRCPPGVQYMIDLRKETLMSLSFVMTNSFENNITFTPDTWWHTLKSICPHCFSEHSSNVQCAMYKVHFKYVMCRIHLSSLLSTEQPTNCKSFSDNFLEFSIVAGSS